MNWNDIQLYKRVEEQITNLGFKLYPSKWTSCNGEIGVFPLEDKNPLYSRDAEIYTGTIEQIACWIRGVQQQKDYLTMLKATSEEKIKTLEEKYVKKLKHQAMLDIIKDPNKKIDKENISKFDEYKNYVASIYQNKLKDNENYIGDTGKIKNIINKI